MNRPRLRLRCPSRLSVPHLLSRPLAPRPPRLPGPRLPGPRLSRPLAPRRPLRSGRGSRWLTAVGVCTVVALAGCGSQVAGSPGRSASSRPATSRPVGTASTIARTVSPRQRATADAARIMADFPRPPGAVRTGLIAGLTEPGVGVGTGDIVTVTRWWRVPGPPRAVLAWVRAHVPPGFTWSGGGTMTSGGPASVIQRSDAYALPPVPGVLTQRQLVVTVAAYQGRTAVRADAQVTWLPARPAAERIPAGVRAVTVTPVSGYKQNAPLDQPDRAFTVTDPARVAGIVALANSLTVYPPGVRSCPADFGGAMRIAFLARPGGPALARFSAEYFGCGTVSVTIGGQAEPALSAWIPSGKQFQDRVLAIAGVRWPHQPGAPAGFGS